MIPVYALKEQQSQANDNSHSTVVKKTEVLLTCNFFTALDFLGFNVERYKQGFRTLDEIFEFVYQSKYFKESYFSLDNRPADMRARDKKRANYGLALDYFAGKGEKTSFHPLFDDEVINQAFPHSLEEMLRLQKQMKIQTKIKESISSKKIVKSLLINKDEAIELVLLNETNSVPLDTNKHEIYVSLTKNILGDDYDELRQSNNVLQKNVVVSHDFLGKMIQQLNKNELVQQGYFVDNQHQEEFNRLILDVFEILY